MKTTIRFTAVVTGVIALAGLVGAQPSQGAVQSSAYTPAPAATKDIVLVQNGNIVLRHGRTGAETTVIAGQTNSSPDVSPDGTRVAFSDYGPCGDSINVVNIDGSGDTQLTHPTCTADQVPAFDDTGAIWSPDGTKIAFNREYESSPVELWVMNSNGSNVHEVSSYSPFPATWSPSGQLAFNDFGNIRVENSNGSNAYEVKVTLPHTCGSVEYPSWSPDGTRIYAIFGECEPDNSDNQNQYLGYLSSNSHFAKGSPVTPVMLTNTPDTVYGPIRIAADDTTLLYDECCNASSQDVIAMNVKTLVTTQLTHDGDDSDPAPVQPTWLAPTACPSLEMMGVRGSRNNSSDLLPYDEVTASTDDFVSDRVDGLKFNSVNYQAIPVDIKQQAFYAANYLRSVADGKSVLQAMLTSFIASCPHTYVMLVGYSQGAQVANDIYHFLPAGDQSHILMALFGNPEFTSLQNAVDFGSYTPGLYGVFTEALEDWFIPKEFVPNVHSYCLAGDTVCNFPGNLVACGAKLKSCPHYHYIDAYTGDAAKWLVSRWLAAPKL